jgi:hypothetical protein
METNASHAQLDQTSTHSLEDANYVPLDSLTTKSKEDASVLNKLHTYTKTALVLIASHHIFGISKQNHVKHVL